MDPGYVATQPQVTRDPGIQTPPCANREMSPQNCLCGAVSHLHCGHLGEASFLPYVSAPTLRKPPRPKNGPGPCKGTVSSALLCTYFPCTWEGPQILQNQNQVAPKRGAPSVICFPRGPLPPSYTPSWFHFQEEPKEEQTAMVPQAIPLRRCRYCLVLVGDTYILLSGPN